MENMCTEDCSDEAKGQLKKLIIMTDDCCYEFDKNGNLVDPINVPNKDGIVFRLAPPAIDI